MYEEFLKMRAHFFFSLDQAIIVCPLLSRVFIRFSLEAAEQAIKNHFSISTMPMIDMHVSVEKLTKTNLDEMLFDQIGVRDFHFLEGILFRKTKICV